VTVAAGGNVCRVSEVRIPSARGEIAGYLAVPQAAVSGPGPYPAVVVVHDVFGVGDDVRAIVDRFATAGYLALAPDLYTDGGLVRCVRTVFRQLRAAEGRAFDDLEAARQLLLARADCTGRSAVVGFCLGGGFALVAAARGFDASAPYYGPLPQDLAALDGACPVVASFGAKDSGELKGAAAKLERALTERDVPHDVREYPEAGHGFANRLPLGPFGPVVRLATGMGYHHASAEDAWQRVLAFFAEHVKG
jgi:carboxymethylenebutenolidase